MSTLADVLRIKQEKEESASKLASEQANLLASEQNSSVAEPASKLATPASPLAETASNSQSASKLASYHTSTLVSELASKSLSAPTASSVKQQWNHRIEPELYEALLTLAELLRVKMHELNTMALVDAVRKYLGDSYLPAGASLLASEQIPPLKELSKLELLNYYSMITGARKRVSVRDRKLFDAAFQAYHPLLVELGLRVAKHDGRDVFSFTFCANAMKFRADWPMDAIIEELKKFRALDGEQ